MNDNDVPEVPDEAGGDPSDPRDSDDEADDQGGKVSPSWEALMADSLVEAFYPAYRRVERKF